MSAPPPTTAVADVLALRGHRCSLSPPLVAFAASAGPVLGPAATVQLAPGTAPGTAFDELYAFLSSDLSDAVLVVAGAETVPGAVWGEILSRASHHAGARAAVVSGGIRDRSTLAAEGLPVWGAFAATVGAVGMARVAAVGDAVAIDGVQVSPGDQILIDADGVVAVPAATARQTFDLARLYAEAEDRVLVDLSSGVKLTHAYEHKRRAARLISEAEK